MTHKIIRFAKDLAVACLIALAFIAAPALAFIAAPALAFIAAPALAFVVAPSGAAENPDLAIQVQSSDPARITGGDALIKIVAKDSAETLSVWVNGRDVTDVLKPMVRRGIISA